MKKTILNVKTFVEQNNYRVIVSSKESLQKEIETPFITIPAVDLLRDFIEIYPKQGIVLSKKEINYFNELESTKREECLKKFITKEVPFIVLTKDIECDELMRKVALKNHVTIIKEDRPPVVIVSEVYHYIKEKLTPYTLLHGTLVEVFGSGVLIRGESGIGKSEISLELIKKGHRLVADDSVLAKADGQRLYGQAPEHLKNLLEVRGLGIIDVYRLFGVTAVNETCEINYIIDLVNLEEIRKENRLAENTYQVEINGIMVPSVHLPVSSGRSMAGLVEVAVMDLRNRTLGYNSTKEFMEKYDRLIKEESPHE